MAYTRTNYKSAKALRADFAAGKPIAVYQPGPFGPDVADGNVYLEGPHYPEAHKWYVAGTVQGGVLNSLNR